MKKITTRKDIIKNIAIVFLAVMLVLTFFSNTIMNWSLAQVNGSYTEYGTIRTGVRGTGTVKANTVYEQAIKGEARVGSVYVREGDWVSEGQVLMMLESTEKGDLKALEEQLETLRTSYNRELLSRESSPDYTLTELDIEDSRNALEELKTKRAEFTDEKILEIVTEYESAEKNIEVLNEQIEKIEEQIKELSETSDDESIVEARKKRDNAKSTLEWAEEQLVKAKEELSEVSYTDLTSLNNQKEQLSRTLAELYSDKTDLQNENSELLSLESVKDEKKTAFETAKKAYEDKKAEYEAGVGEGGTLDPEKQAELDALLSVANTAETEYNTALSAYETNKDDIKVVLSQIKSLDSQIDDVQYQQSNLNKQISSAKSENKTYERLEAGVENAEESVESTKKVLEEAEKALEDAVFQISKDLNLTLKTANANLKDGQKRLEEAKEAFLEVEGLDELDKEIKSAERTLFEKEYNFEKTKKADEKAKELTDFDFSLKLKEINELAAQIASIKGESQNGETEFVSKYTGRITALSARTGDTLADGSVVVSIEAENGGYSLSFSVSANDASKIREGDTASVSGGWWGSNIEAILTSSKFEKGGKTKLLTFDIRGDVTEGQTLTLLAGEKTTSYSSVVPKSAVHEDADGKFIYIAKTKSTPLGNRYIATRLPVTVVASDDVNCAISTDDTYLYEFAITSSTKPISDGEYVRLAD